MALYSANMNIMMKAAEKAAKHLIRDFGEVEHLQISQKGPADFVSAADKKSEKIIHEELSKARPTFGFLMEEGGEIKGEENKRWIIDPIDGTTNFIHAIPYWCISIALEEEGVITAGLVYNPVLDEMFRAEKGSGAFMKHQRLRVSNRRNPLDAVVATGDYLLHAPYDRFFKIQQLLCTKFGRVRNYGAMALDLAYVAAGRQDGYVSKGFQAHDSAAGSLIVREAGGFASTFDNKPDIINNDTMVAGNPHIHEELLKTLKNA